MDLLPDLIAIGFTEYEAKVYTSLLGEHPATGYQISKASGVPRSMVYEALGRLHARGAVLKTDEPRATLYRPVPPDLLLNRFEQDHHIRIQNLRERLHLLFAGQEGDHLWSIRDPSAVSSYIRQMIASAQQELLFLLPDAELEAFRGEILGACERGVQVGALLTGQGSLECGEIAHHPPLESELQQLDNMLVVVEDDQECLVAHTGSEVAATVTSNPNFVRITRQFIWMELFAQRLYRRLGPELLDRLDPQDRRIFDSFTDGGR